MLPLRLPRLVVFPRHFHTGPNPVAGDENDGNAAAAAAAPDLHPADVLYRNALESIFSSADLKDWQR